MELRLVGCFSGLKKKPTFKEIRLVSYSYIYQRIIIRLYKILQGLGVGPGSATEQRKNVRKSAFFS